MAIEDKVVITAALTGVAANRNQCKWIPYTPQEIAEEALACYNAGASVVHIHARENDGSPSWRVEVFREIMDEVRKKCPIIINFSTGAVLVERDDRIAHIRELKPEIAALNMGTMNYAKYSPKRKSFVFSVVFHNPFEDIIFFLDTMNQLGIKPECECFDLGHLESIFPLIDMGLLKNFQVSLIMGVVGGMAATARNLAHVASLVPAGIAWEVIGISQEQWLLVATALALGGNIRVGLEDNFYLSPGEMSQGNGPLVEKAVRMTRDIGREPATVAEARAILKVREI
ncbi:MAG: 3-keto-5-aminohexanoate cleavage protein [Dehalococcoidia bacterium]|nr:3-keto-5-aminohexanoate cleavage protein [Dehalococcoidia bacterium]